MFSDFDFTACESKLPFRQGFYRVQLEDGQTPIAEFKKEGAAKSPAWFIWESATPTEEKKPRRCENVVAWTKASEKEVAAAMYRHLTEQERIDTAYEKFKLFCLGDVKSQFGIPEHRKLKVGDEVVVGNLSNCVVIDTRFDGVLVCVSHDRHENAKLGHNEETRYPNEITVWHWSEVLRKSDVNKRPSISNKRHNIPFTNGSLSSLVFGFIENRYVVNTQYQRGYVWTHDDQQRYLNSVFQGRDCGRFILVKNEYPVKTEILDGQQRLTTLALFVMGHINYGDIPYHEMSFKDHIYLDNLNTAVATLNSTDYSLSELLSVFIEENTGGVPQTEEHLQYVQQLREALRSEGK